MPRTPACWRNEHCDRTRVPPLPATRPSRPSQQRQHIATALATTIAMRWRWARHVSAPTAPVRAAQLHTGSEDPNRVLKSPTARFARPRPRANGQRGRAHSRPCARGHAHSGGALAPGADRAGCALSEEASENQPQRAHAHAALPGVPVAIECARGQWRQLTGLISSASHVRLARMTPGTVLGWRGRHGAPGRDGRMGRPRCGVMPRSQQ